MKAAIRIELFPFGCAWRPVALGQRPPRLSASSAELALEKLPVLGRTQYPYLMPRPGRPVTTYCMRAVAPGRSGWVLGELLAFVEPLLGEPLGHVWFLLMDRVTKRTRLTEILRGAQGRQAPCAGRAQPATGSGGGSSIPRVCRLSRFGRLRRTPANRVGLRQLGLDPAPR